MNNVIYCMAAVLGFGVTAFLGRWLIPFLHKLHFGQTIREIGPSWHKNKQGTPTMGGLMFIIGITAAMAVCVPAARGMGYGGDASHAGAGAGGPCHGPGLWGHRVYG